MIQPYFIFLGYRDSKITLSVFKNFFKVLMYYIIKLLKHIILNDF